MKGTAAMLRSLLFLPFVLLPLAAQTDPTALQTITSGSYDDRNPALDRSAVHWMSNDAQWLLFERGTADSSFIMAKRYVLLDRSWDSSETVIAASPASLPLTGPDLASMYSSVARFCAVWQRSGGTKPEVFYSYFDSSLHWSAPVLLGIGEQPVVTAFPYTGLGMNGKNFILWKEGGTILGAVLTPGGVETKDTIALAGVSGTAYDVGSAGGTIHVVHTVPAGPSWMKMVRSTVKLPAVTVTSYDTLIPRVPYGAEPRFIQALSTATLLWTSSAEYDMEIAGTTLSPFSPQTVPQTGFGLKRGIRAYTTPVVTAKGGARPSYLWLNMLAYSRDNGVDTVLVIHGPSVYAVDTVRSTGYDRAPSIGSFYVPGQYTMVVWESDRSGRPHIYGKLVYNPIGAAEEEGPVVRSFLLRAYPNPFNPSTTIEYVLPERAEVTLEVFDMLGRRTALLDAGRRDAGRHTARFDGTGHSSGIYLARLRSGARTVTERMLLLR